MQNAWTVTASDGVELAVHDFGGAGPALLLAHATGYCACVWVPVVESLRSHFRCIAPDCRAHGLSGRPSPDGFSWGQLGADVLAIVDAIPVSGPWVAAGHSAGGAGLLLAEVERPGTFEGLWCFEPVLFPPRALREDEEEETGNPMAEAARGRRSQFRDKEEAMAHYEGREPFKRFARPALAGYLDGGLVPEGTNGRMRLACHPEDEARFYEMGGFEETWGAVEAVGCPTTFVTGDQPGAFGAGHAELLAGRLPYGQAEVLSGLSHFGPLEDPAAVADSILDSVGQGET